MGKLRVEIRRRINWILYLAKRVKPYDVTQTYDNKGNYKYSVLCLNNRLSSKCGNFIRIKYDARECEIDGKVSKTMKEDILRY